LCGEITNIIHSETSSLRSLNLRFPLIYTINLQSLVKGHKISVKISLNLHVVTVVFPTSVHLNFEVSTAETPSDIHASPFVKL
jgi:hypothetical protein